MIEPNANQNAERMATALKNGTVSREVSITDFLDTAGWRERRFGG
jgi:hypothetical protein